MDLFKNLLPGTTLLTPNRRLAASYLKRHHQWMAERAITTWPSLDILPLTSWLQRLWHELACTSFGVLPHLLTNLQLQLLWQRILTQSPEHHFLIKIEDTAELAKTAWQTLKLWSVELSHPELDTTHDGKIFLAWAKGFRDYCEKFNLIDEASLPAALLKQQTLALPQQIILIGFNDLAPQLKHFFTKLESRGVIVTEYFAENLATTTHYLSLDTEEAEMFSMAKWASALHAKDASKKIACVIPGLEKLRDQAFSIFKQVFMTTGELNTLPFNISAGKNLSHYPVIFSALEILKLIQLKLDYSQLSHLLRTPFLADAETEMLARAKFDFHVQQNPFYSLSLSDLLSRPLKVGTQIHLKQSCPLFYETLEKLNTAIINLPVVAQLGEWLTHFTNLLNLAGWPGERSLNSEEFQVVRSWLDLLKTINTVDLVLAPMHAQAAFNIIQMISKQTLFQPQTPETQIQILGMLEAAQIPFDYLWVMGLDDTVWPPKPTPNPFIPQKLQRKLSMPHATADRELTYCQDMTQQLIQSTPVAIFSHAKQNKDGELNPSPLITQYPRRLLSDLPQAQFTQIDTKIFASKNMIYFTDDKAPSLTPSQVQSGGANIFKLQALCPFKAFAELRLKAASIEAPRLGLKPHERGTLFHTSLEFIWKKLKDQATLHAMDNAALQVLVIQSIAMAFKKITHLETSVYIQLEMQRIHKIIMMWLEIEKNRPWFKVLAQEQETILMMHNTRIKLRIDRIDEVAGGKKIIIDYKTGKYNNIKSWFGPRLDEPQLPIYCITDPDNIAGVVFAQLNIEKIELKGVGDVNNWTALKSLSEVPYAQTQDWSQQIQAWQHDLASLHTAFCHGEAAVDPKNPGETCSHCQLQAFCRVNETLSLEIES